ncbi:unnamed protein product [Adineta ricciae]|uniref:G-protein coupled receptors family 1 profile domain-containing protein n=1 Tax=Adineta ricciae TaxID=249248 RepID=A0A815LKS6_ADIRI|nr:unnamed protein product [Adineta ricciae]CAF1409772.1 unnamed protein product [Adineta ricciae]
MLRSALNNHVIIVLLIMGLIEELTDIPWYIHYYRTGTAFSLTSAFCYTWAYIGSNIYVLNFILMAWASIERHMLIFHSKWFATRWICFALHYLPIAICLIVPSLFYLFTYFILPCDTSFNYNGALCGLYTCVLNHRWGLYFDSLINYLIPIWVTVIFSTALFVRVIYQKYRVHQKIIWRNYKKLAGQLLLISALYVSLQFPPMILYAAYSIGLPCEIGADYYNNSMFFTYWIILFTPFTIVVSLPELQMNFRRLMLFWRHRNSITPK